MDATAMDGGYGSEVGVRTSFPAWSMERIYDEARRYAQRPETGSWPEQRIERLAVNMLRHRFTDYETNKSRTRHREANYSIADHYPMLATEARRQVMARAEQDKLNRADIRKATAAARAAVARRLETLAVLHVGQAVSVQASGHACGGVITKVGRSKLTVRLDTGREVRVYDSEVSPLGREVSQVA